MSLQRLFPKVAWTSFSAGFQRHRREGIGVAALALLALTLIPLGFMGSRLQNDYRQWQGKARDFQALRQQYQQLAQEVDRWEQKGRSDKNRGLGEAVDPWLTSLGIRQNFKGMKGMTRREIKSRITEENADVQLEKITTDDLVQLLYQLDQAPEALSVKKIHIKKSFSGPERLDVLLNLSLFSLKATARP